MEKEEIIDAIRNATNGTFVPECHLATCMGYLRVYDKKGRNVSTDPNYYSGTINIDGTNYPIVRHAWKAYIFKPEYECASYTWLWTEDVEEKLLATVDLTPDYIKEYYSE